MPNSCLPAIGPPEPICVIGAGSSGLVAAKSLRQCGFPVEVLERERDLGGIWNYGLPCGRAYRSTHMVSSKRCTEFPDFPMPREYPQYPHHEQVLAYLRAYADHFRLHDAIQYGQAVERIEPIDEGRAWSVRLSGGETRQYAAVVIANGHHWSPRWPEYPGQFDGLALHSADYKSPDSLLKKGDRHLTTGLVAEEPPHRSEPVPVFQQAVDVLAGKRVLVVGGGNSGCDIAVEAAQHNCLTFHSTRRGYHYVPKWILGVPSDRAADRLHRWHLPLWLRRLIIAGLLRIAVGRQSHYRLPNPDHRLFETHPIVNSLLPYHAGQGDIHARPDVARLEGDRVRFVDGTTEPIDVIVYATGYNLEFPFIDRELLAWRDGRPALYLNVFHPRYDNLFVAGMIQPDSGIFALAHWQTVAISRFLAAVRQGRPAADLLRRRKAADSPPLSGGIQYSPSPRHAIEVEHWSYMKSLQRLVKQL